MTTEDRRGFFRQALGLLAAPFASRVAGGGGRGEMPWVELEPLVGELVLDVSHAVTGAARGTLPVRLSTPERIDLPGDMTWSGKIGPGGRVDLYGYASGPIQWPPPATLPGLCEAIYLDPFGIREN